MIISPWRKSLRQATFRGVPFYTKTTSSEQGRRNAVHEYPMRDIPYVEDIGLKGRAFTLEAYVVGPDYMPARDKLIVALETPGAGTLVHPYRGTLNVALTAPARITESADEGGMARFSLTFTETTTNNQPAVRPDTAALVGNAADAANVALSANAANKFSITGAADFVASGAQSIANGALNAVTGVAKFLNTGTMGELMHSAQTISGSLAILMQKPQMMTDAIQSQIYSLAALVNTPRDAWNEMQAFFGNNATATFPVPYVAATTPSTIQQYINQTAIVDLVRITAIVEATRASSQMTFTSYNEAQAALNLLADALDAELVSNPMASSGQPAPLDDDVYDALTELRVAMVRDISTRGANLATLTTITLPSTMPALVAAYRIYGDCTQDADLVARNNIRRPGFVQGGMPLEVLTNV